MTSATLPAIACGEGTLRLRDLARMIPVIPRNVVLAVLHTYRRVVSPLYGDVCKYYPSCSAYAVGSVQQHGVVKGAALSALRLARCHPWARGGIDDVRPHAHFRYDLTRHGFVVPEGKD